MHQTMPTDGNRGSCLPMVLEDNRGSTYSNGVKNFRKGSASFSVL